MWAGQGPLHPSTLFAENMMALKGRPSLFNKNYQIYLGFSVLHISFESWDKEIIMRSKKLRVVGTWKFHYASNQPGNHEVHQKQPNKVFSEYYFIVDNA